MKAPSSQLRGFITRFSSAVFVYGIALTYGATGSTNLAQIADYLSKNVVASNGVLLGGLAQGTAATCSRTPIVGTVIWYRHRTGAD